MCTLQPPVAHRAVVRVHAATTACSVQSAFRHCRYARDTTVRALFPNGNCADLLADGTWVRTNNKGLRMARAADGREYGLEGVAIVQETDAESHRVVTSRADLVRLSADRSRTAPFGGAASVTSRLLLADRTAHRQSCAAILHCSFRCLSWRRRRVQRWSSMPTTRASSASTSAPSTSSGRPSSARRCPAPHRTPLAGTAYLTQNARAGGPAAARDIRFVRAHGGARREAHGAAGRHGAAAHRREADGDKARRHPHAGPAHCGHICAGTGPHLRRDLPTSAPGLAHICSGTDPAG